MKKEKLISLLNEGLSVEEIPTITNLKEIEEVVKKFNFDAETSKKLNEKIQRLEKETIGHANAFSSMIKITAQEK
ncbi:Uncharacterised protein [uncultured archaeon]|nr:Uncharacterised protein [uncultured archaeon]